MASSHKLIENLCKCIAISGLIYNFFSNSPSSYSPMAFFSNSIHKSNSYGNQISSPTNISHIVFGIAGSSNTWPKRKAYIESWWRPNETRRYLFLENFPNDSNLPWPSSSPPVKIYGDTSRYRDYNRHPMPHAIRMVRIIAETFREMSEGARWYVMADDDTVVFVENLVGVQSGYDHTKYYYIGANSECVAANIFHSFGMVFSGAGYALSYPAAEAVAVAKNLDGCI